MANLTNMLCIRGNAIHRLEEASVTKYFIPLDYLNECKQYGVMKKDMMIKPRFFYLRQIDSYIELKVSPENIYNSFTLNVTIYTHTVKCKKIGLQVFTQSHFANGQTNVSISAPIRGKNMYTYTIKTGNYIHEACTSSFKEFNPYLHFDCLFKMVLGLTFTSTKQEEQLKNYKEVSIIDIMSKYMVTCQNIKYNDILDTFYCYELPLEECPDMIQRTPETKEYIMELTKTVQLLVKKENKVKKEDLLKKVLKNELRKDLTTKYLDLEHKTRYLNLSQ